MSKPGMSVPWASMIAGGLGPVARFRRSSVREMLMNYICRWGGVKKERELRIVPRCLA